MTNSFFQSVANPKSGQHKGKVLHFEALQSANPCRSGSSYNVEGFMDLCRIDRLTEIGGDWGGQFRLVNAVPMRQFRPNLRPIETPFWIGKISSIRENRGRSYAMQGPIRCQSWLSRTDNLLPIRCQSVASQLPMQCRWLANPSTILCQSLPNPAPIWCQFSANPTSF